MDIVRKEVNVFKNYPTTENDQINLTILDFLTKNDFITVSEVASQVSGDISDNVETLLQKKLLVKDGDDISLNTKFPIILGINFSGENACISLCDIKGKIIRTKIIAVGVKTGTIKKKKDIHGLVDLLAREIKDLNMSISFIGVATPMTISIELAQTLAEGLIKKTKAGVLIVHESTSSGYAEYYENDKEKNKSFLYMHTDMGHGVVIKNNMIFEANNDNSIRAYLRPWQQFSMASVAKDLVDKGVGTNMVNIANGSIDDITLEVVLEAAQSKDEVAQDLVKRSGLALGVRVAYLTNMFDASNIVIGIGAGVQETSFIEFVHHSADKFMNEERKKTVSIEPGKLGKEAGSVGAALVCRRELFMEV